MRYLALALCVCLFGCTGPEEEMGQPGDDDDLDLNELDLEVAWTYEINPANQYGAIAEVTADRVYPAEVWIEYGLDFEFNRSTPRYSLSETDQVTLQILALKADKEYQSRLVVRADGSNYYDDEVQKIATDPIPDHWPICKALSEQDLESFDDEEVFCTNFGPSGGEGVPFVGCVDRQGDPVWEMNYEDEIMNNFTPLSNGGFAGTGRSSEFAAVFNRFGELETRFSMTMFSNQEPGTRFFHQYMNEHELIEIHEGPWAGALAILTLTEEGIDDPETEEVDHVTHWAPGILVFDPQSGDLLWDWTAHGDHGDGVPIDPKLAYFRYGMMDPGVEIWMHGNALVHEHLNGQDYFWISARTQDWIFKISVKDDSVVWRFGHEGDFTLVKDIDAAELNELQPASWNFAQHDPELLSRDGDRVRFMVFDNGNVRPDADGYPSGAASYSRAVEFEFDESTMLAMINFEYGDSDPDSPDHFFSHIYGNAVLLPDDQGVLYTCGDNTGGPFEEESWRYFAEVDYAEGEELWRFTCEDRYFYRALYFSSIYHVTW